jgi:TrmH family RNA methyltransferase
MTEPRHIQSRDNPLVARVRKLAADGAAYRRGGEAWLEGDHLCSALRARGRPALQALIAESAWAGDARLRELALWAPQVAVLADPVFKALSGLESPAPIGFLVAVPASPAIDPQAPTMVLDRLQDAGNVGSILRSASAFGFTQVLALHGTAALWSPKVLRAGMGAHFNLQLCEGLRPDDLQALTLPLVGTSSHAEAVLCDAPLPWPCAWVLGHEGQGVAPELAARCSLLVRIPQPGGEESLNVAAAAAVCLYESAGRRH